MKMSIMLLLSLLLPGLAFAANPLAYVGLSYGQSAYEGDEVRAAGYEKGQRVDEDGDSFSVYLGYRAHPHISLELGYLQYEEFSGQFSIDPNIVFVVAPNTIESVDLQALSFGAVFDYPLWSRIDVLAETSYRYFDVDRNVSGGFSPRSGSLDGDNADSDAGFYFGVGARCRISSNLAARVQWGRTMADDFDLDTIALSLEIGFGAF